MSVDATMPRMRAVTPPVQGHVGHDGLTRQRFSIRRPDGAMLRGLHLTSDRPTQGDVVLTSGFGKSLRHNGFMAAHLARTGLAVWRPDFVDHPGVSDGDMANATLDSARIDIQSLSDDILPQSKARPLILVSSSLSARAAIRAAMVSDRYDMVLLIMPVVDLGSTIAAVTGSDLVGLAQQGRLSKADDIEVLGHVMKASFVHDAIENGYETRHSSRDELSRVSCPISVIAVENDDWVDLDDLRFAMDDTKPNRRLHVIAATDHHAYSFEFMRMVGNILTDEIETALPLGLDRARDLTFGDHRLIVASDRDALTSEEASPHD